MHDKTEKKAKPHKNRIYVLTEVADTSLLKRPAKAMVVSAPAPAKAREAASLEDPKRPAVWLDALSHCLPHQVVP